MSSTRNIVVLGVVIRGKCENTPKSMTFVEIKGPNVGYGTVLCTPVSHLSTLRNFLAYFRSFCLATVQTKRRLLFMLLSCSKMNQQAVIWWDSYWFTRINKAGKLNCIWHRQTKETSPHNVPFVIATLLKPNILSSFAKVPLGGLRIKWSSADSAKCFQLPWK